MTDKNGSIVEIIVEVRASTFAGIAGFSQWLTEIDGLAWLDGEGVEVGVADFDGSGLAGGENVNVIAVFAETFTLVWFWVFITTDMIIIAGL